MPDPSSDPYTNHLLPAIEEDSSGAGAMEREVSDIFAVATESQPGYVRPAMQETEQQALNVMRTNETARQDIHDLFVNNEIEGTPITPVLGNSPVDQIYKQRRLLEIYQDDPQAARAIAAHHVAGFHVSRSGSLLSTLEHGLLPAYEARRRENVDVFDGERAFSPDGGQDYLSYADWTYMQSISQYARAGHPVSTEQLEQYVAAHQQDIDEHESEINDETYWLARYVHANKKQRVADATSRLSKMRANNNPEWLQLTEDNFPVAYGIDIEGYAIKAGSWHAPKSQAQERAIDRFAPGDISGEFMVLSREVSPAEFGVIAVPRARVEQVQQIVSRGGHDVKVIPLELLVAPDIAETYRRFEAQPSEGEPHVTHTKQNVGATILKKIFRR